MAETQIITNQYVQIDQTPAGIGNRIFARLIDYLIMLTYTIGAYHLIDWFESFIFSRYHELIYFLIFIPVVFYSFLWEIFNHGRSPGKALFGMRVVMRDGATPAIGAYWMRWMLLMIDTISWFGLFVMLIDRNNRRLGDLAAGTIVIKERDYSSIHVSLDEYDFLRQGYRPTYPQADNLSLEQIATINESLLRRDAGRPQRIAFLSSKVREFLNIVAATSKPVDDETFLRTIVRDYQYYALEEI